MIDRLPAGAQQPIPRLQAGAFRGRVRNKLADDRRQRTRSETKPRPQRFGLGQFRLPSANVQLHRSGRAVGALYGHLNVSVAQQLAEDGKCRRLQRWRGLSADRENLVVRSQAGRCRRGVRRHLADVGLETRHAVDEHQPIREDSEQKIEPGAGGQYGDAVWNGTLGEGHMPFGFRNGPFTLVQQFYIAAQGNSRNPVFGGLRFRSPGGCRRGGIRFRTPANQRLAETHRESQDLESQSARDKEMPILVKRHEYSNRDDESQNRKNHLGHLPYTPD